MNESHIEIESEFSLEKLAEQVSILIVKPELTDTSAPLFLLLKNKGFSVVRTFHKEVDEKALQGMYSGMDTWTIPVQQATRDHMLNKEVEILIVTKDTNSQVLNVTTELSDFRGDKIIPADNAPGTLRKEFEEELKGSDDPSIPYFKNGFHCPRNTEELITNLEAFNLMEEAKQLYNRTI